MVYATIHTSYGLKRLAQMKTPLRRGSSCLYTDTFLES